MLKEQGKSYVADWGEWDKVAEDEVKVAARDIIKESFFGCAGLNCVPQKLIG